jgi:hypothetical protein
VASQKVLEHYLRQLRLIEEHREKWCEQNVRRHYKDLMTDLQEFIGVEYAQLAQDDKLTYEILHSKAQHARFIEEVEQRVNKFTPKAAKEIRDTVRLTYKHAYQGMADAVEKSKTHKELKANLKGLRAVTPDIIKNAVKNPYMEQALEKNHKDVITGIRQQIGIGLSQGDRMRTMARRISEELDRSYRRATMIARTECHRFREAGYQDSSERIAQRLKEDGSDYVMVKTWKTMQDSAVRPQRKSGKGKKAKFTMGSGPNHIKMHGVTILVDEEFDLGNGAKAKTPGQSGVAGHDINCRCYLSRDLITKEEYEKLTGKKLKEDYDIAQYETQEKILLDEKEKLEEDRDKLQLEKLNLESKEYSGIWKETVTPADYEAKKDKIQAKRDYFNEQIKLLEEQKANGTVSKYIDADAVIDKSKKHLKDLDDFEAQGKAYLKLNKQLTDVNTRLTDIDDEVKVVRQKLMKAKGIDPDKIQKEIDDLASEINTLSSKTSNLTINSKIKEFHGELEEALKNAGVPDKAKFHLFEDETAKDVMEFYLSPDEQTKFKQELKKLVKNNPEDAKQLKKLQKQLQDKSNELEKIRKRYGLEDDAFSQARKDNALWFTDKNGGARAADAVYRPKAGEVWRGASAAQKKSAYEYTQSFHKYNEPLRGIEYGTNKFIGVGKVDLDDIGVSTGYGMRKGEVKALINDLTDYIDQSSYDYDIWLNRGCRRSGMDKFFNINPSDFDLSQEELAAKILGTTPTEYGFMSTGVARGKGFSGEIKLNIYAPKGTKMAYVEPFSAFGHGDGLKWDGIKTQSSISYEAEMLLQRGTKFRVIKVEKQGSQWYIDLEVIGQETIT